MNHDSLRELYIEELRDIFSAENQLTKALPKMAKAASSKELRQGFEHHLEQTKTHVERLESIFEMLEEKATGKKCAGMEGLIKEGAEVMSQEFEEDSMDSALISAARRVEHYEIAAYASAASYADALGEGEQASLLRETLEEEKETDEKLTEMAGELLQDLESADESEGVDADTEEGEEDAKSTIKTRKGKAGKAA